MSAFDGTKKLGPDARIEKEIAAHCKKYTISPLDAVKHFPVLARRQALKRFLAHTELFKMTLDIPGDIADLGVFRGLSLMTWANLLEAYCIGDRTKTVYGFDTWKGFTRLARQDGKQKKDIQKFEGGFSPEQYYQELQDAVAIYDKDRFVSWKPRVKLIKGDISRKVPSFVKDNPGVRFSLVHFDCDVYKPTKSALTSLWPYISRGGVILFDEYAIKDWAGETQAVDEFLKDKPDVRVKTLPWTNSPAGYIIKP